MEEQIEKKKIVGKKKNRVGRKKKGEKEQLENLIS